MLRSYPIFLIFLLSCSYTKQLNNKWVGKTDQDIVNEYGVPETVLNDTLKGKVYIYSYKPEPRLATIKYSDAYKVGVYSASETIIQEKNIFHFDSTNKVVRIFCQDTTYKSKGNYFRLSKR